MSHHVKDAIAALDRAIGVDYDPNRNVFIVRKNSKYSPYYVDEYYDTDFKPVPTSRGDRWFDYRPPTRQNPYVSLPHLDPALEAVEHERALHGLSPYKTAQEAAFEAVDAARAKMGLTPGGLRTRAIILPTDEVHSCASCGTELRLGGKAYGVGNGPEVIPVCSLHCATDYAHHHGG